MFLMVAIVFVVNIITTVTALITLEACSSAYRPDSTYLSTASVLGSTTDTQFTPDCFSLLPLGDLKLNLLLL